MLNQHLDNSKDVLHERQDIIRLWAHAYQLQSLGITFYITLDRSIFYKITPRVNLDVTLKEILDKSDTKGIDLCLESPPVSPYPDPSPVSNISAAIVPQVRFCSDPFYYFEANTGVKLSEIISLADLKISLIGCEEYLRRSLYIAFLHTLYLDTKNIAKIVETLVIPLLNECYDDEVMEAAFEALDRVNYTSEGAKREYLS